MDVQHSVDDAGNLNIQISLSPVERACLHHDLPGDQGIVEWFSKGPSSEKVVQCRQRLERRWIPKLLEKGINVPADDNERLQLILSQPDYQSREQRDG